MIELLPEVPIPMSRSAVYFAQAETGQIKIGRSTRLVDRLATLRQCSPVALRFVGWTPEGGGREVGLHLAFAADRLHGEWFRPSAAIVDLIERLRGQPPQIRNIFAKAAIGYPPLIHEVVSELKSLEPAQGGHNGGTQDA